MTQPAYKVDVLQVNPGASGTRTIARDVTTNGLRFVDPLYPAGVLLSDMVGLQSLVGVSVVGTTSVTIQEAIDASTGTMPVILIPSGLYSENLVITKDIVLVGLGYVKITNTTADHTIVIQEGESSVPRFVQIRNLVVECTEDGLACLHIDGSNTYATGSVVVDALLAVGDTITIAGNVLTGVAGARTSGSDNFNASLVTVNALAAEISAALNDVDNSFASLVGGVATTDTVAITAVTAGSSGNAITLEANTTPSGNLIVSGATLEGGGGLNSEVGLTEIAILDSTLLATGVGTRQINAEIMNNIRVAGGSWLGSSSTSESFISQCASFNAFSVAWLNDIQAAYDNSNPQPAITTADFKVTNCGRLNTLITNYIGEGAVALSNIPIVGDVTINGDRSFTSINCEMGETLIEDTVSARLVNSTRTSLGGLGTPTVAESSLVWISAVDGDTDTVTFDRTQPDLNYAVLIDVPVAGVIANVTEKADAYFTVTFSSPITADVFYTILRQM